MQVQLSKEQMETYANSFPTLEWFPSEYPRVILFATFVKGEMMGLQSLCSQ